MMQLQAPSGKECTLKVDIVTVNFNRRRVQSEKKNQSKRIVKSLNFGKKTTQINNRIEKCLQLYYEHSW